VITAVIGATGRVGRAAVDGLLAADVIVVALVRDGHKARELFGYQPRLHICELELDNPGKVAAQLTGVDTVLVAVGSVGVEGCLQHIALQAAAASSIDQLVRLSVLSASPTSLGINQRAHWEIDFAAEAAGVPYTTIRPAIFSASLLAGAKEVQSCRTWTGLAETGRVGLIDHRDVADVLVRVVVDPTTWGRHHDLTGPTRFSWPEAMALLSTELGETVLFQTTSETELIERLIADGVAPGQAALLVAREWSIAAGENERTTTTVRELTAHEPRSVADFLHEHRDLFA
jgi:NAD(P)H dehydrogenase (quinone)